MRIVFTGFTVIAVKEVQRVDIVIAATDACMKFLYWPSPRDQLLT
jgi:hypothetical protein